MTPLEDQSRTDLVKEKVDERHEMPWDLSNHSDRDLPPPLNSTEKFGIRIDWYPIQDEDTDELGNVESSTQEEEQK